MIAKIIGILLLVGAVYWVGVAIRGFPPGSYKSGIWLRQSSWTDILTASGISLGCLIAGLVLLIYVA